MAGPQANIPVLRLLLTEDNPADAELELRELKRAGLRIAHRIADTEQGFVSALREFRSEERRVGKECRPQGWADPQIEKKIRETGRSIVEVPSDQAVETDTH